MSSNRLFMSSNQRTSYRCRTAEGAKAVLANGRRHVVVELVDQSAGGFAIQFRGKPRVRLGGQVKLRTNAGWCEATVMRIERCGSETRLGLRRDRELIDARTESLLTRSSLLPIFASGAVGCRTSPLGAFLRIMLAVVVGFWIATSYPVWLPTISEWISTTGCAELFNSVGFSADDG